MADPVEGRGWPQYSADDVLAAVSAAVEAERSRIRAAVQALRSYHWTAEASAWVRASDVRRAIEQETGE